MTGFRDAETDTTFGRPVGVTVDPRGALIVADDLANIVWRVARSGAVSTQPVEPDNPESNMPGDRRKEAVTAKDEG